MSQPDAPDLPTTTEQRVLDNHGDDLVSARDIPHTDSPTPQAAQRRTPRHQRPVEATTQPEHEMDNIQPKNSKREPPSPHWSRHTKYELTWLEIGIIDLVVVGFLSVVTLCVAIALE